MKTRSFITVLTVILSVLFTFVTIGHARERSGLRVIKEATSPYHYEKTKSRMVLDPLVVGGTPSFGRNFLSRIYYDYDPAIMGTEKFFGASVSIDNNYAIIGEPNYSSPSVTYSAAPVYEGAAHICALDAGKECARRITLTSPNVSVSREAHYGAAVSISGTYAIVGAPYNDDTRRDAGAAFIYERDEGAENWSRVQDLYPIRPRPSSGYHYGASVSISGDNAIIGAPGYHSLPRMGGDYREGAGMAEIYTRTSIGTWQHDQYLTIQDEEDDVRNDKFGSSVFIHGNYAIVGAPEDDEAGLDAGAAYIFMKNSDGDWVKQQKLIPIGAFSGDKFGSAVAMNDRYAIVGAPLDDYEGTNSGAAYIFQNSGGSWTRISKLKAGDPSTGDYFGTAVGISTRFAVIGAPGEDHRGLPNAGSGYIFREEDGWWAENLKFDAGAYDAADGKFGASIGFDGHNIIVGAPGTRGFAGTAFIY